MSTSEDLEHIMDNKDDAERPTRARITHIDEPDHWYDQYDGAEGAIVGEADFRGTHFTIIALDKDRDGLELMVKDDEFEVID